MAGMTNKFPFSLTALVDLLTQSWSKHQQLCTQHAIQRVNECVTLCRSIINLAIQAGGPDSRTGFPERKEIDC